MILIYARALKYGMTKEKKKKAKQNTCPHSICYYLNPLIEKLGSGFEETKSPHTLQKKLNIQKFYFISHRAHCSPN